MSPWRDTPPNRSNLTTVSPEDNATGRQYPASDTDTDHSSGRRRQRRKRRRHHKKKHKRKKRSRPSVHFSSDTSTGSYSSDAASSTSSGSSSTGTHRSHKKLPKALRGKWPSKFDEMVVRAYLTWTQSQSYEDLPDAWKTFLAAEPKTGRSLVLQQDVLGWRKQRMPGFIGPEWQYLPSFATELSSGLFTPKGARKQDWWVGIVGNHIRRPTSEITTHLKYQSYDLNARLMLSQHNLQERESKAPSVRKSYRELLALVGRIVTFTHHYFPRSLLQRNSSSLLQYLEQNETDLDKPEWLDTKTGDIIMWLRACEAHDFGGELCTLDDFSNPNGALFPSNTHQDTLPSLAHICGGGLVYLNEARPLELRSKPKEAPISTTAPSPGQATKDKGRGKPGTTTQPPPGPSQAKDPPAEKNTSFSPIFRDFWASAPEKLQVAALGKIFKATDNTNTSTVLESLGLPKRACGHFHIKGACKSARFCAKNNLTHDPVTIDPAKAKEVCTLMNNFLGAPGPS